MFFHPFFFSLQMNMVPMQVLLVLVLVSFVRGSFYFIGGSNGHNQPSIYPPSTPPTVGMIQIKRKEGKKQRGIKEVT